MTQQARVRCHEDTDIVRYLCRRLMSRWYQGSRSPSGGGRPRYFGYILVLSQCLVLVGYILPWSETDESMFLEAVSYLTQASTEGMVEMGAALIACFFLTSASLVFTFYMIWTDDAKGRAFHVSSLSASIGLAGPLIYVQTLLEWRPEWPELYERLTGEMSLGLFMAIWFGCVSALVGVYALARPPGSVRGRRATEGGSDSRRSEVLGPVPIALLVVLASGVAVATFGYFKTWASGELYVINAIMDWSKTGLDEAPLMCLVPIALGAGLVLTFLGQVVGGRTGAACSSAALNAVVMALVLTALWGLMIGDLELTMRSLRGELTLQPGWYVFLGGQVLALVCLVPIWRSRWRRVVLNEKRVASGGQMK